VICDFGGVLTMPVRDSISAWLEADGIRPESFTGTLKEWLGRNAEAGTPIHRLETGELSEAEFDALLAARLTTYDGTPVDPTGVLKRVFGDMTGDPAMYRLVEDLKTAGIRVALLSNSWGDRYPRAQLDELFDEVVISGEVGLRKPDAAIYRLALDRLDVAPEETVFVDDAEPNLHGARAVGLATVLHTDAASTRAALAALVPSLATLEESR
jgi:putative hydrolase of the HAD superfamily